MRLYIKHIVYSIVYISCIAVAIPMRLYIKHIVYSIVYISCIARVDSVSCVKPYTGMPKHLIHLIKHFRL